MDTTRKDTGAANGTRFEVHKEKGEAFFITGAYEAAVVEWKKAIEIRADAGVKCRIEEARAKMKDRAVQEQVARGDKLCDDRLYREAIRAWTEALEPLAEADPRRPEVWKKIESARRREKVRRAVVWAAVVVPLAAILLFGTSHFVHRSENDRLTEANAALQRAIDLERDGDLEGAAQEYKIVAEKYSDTTAGEEAKQRIHKIGSFGRKSTTSLRDGEEFAKAKQWDKAIEAFEKVLRDPQYKETEAAAAAEKGIKKARWGAAAQRAQELKDDGKLEEALAAVRKANVLAAEAGEEAIPTKELEDVLSKKDDLDFAVAYANGQWALWKGDRGRAEKLFAQAVALKPDDEWAKRLSKLARAGVPDGMAFVPGGEFLMGSMEASCPDEMPPHVVDVKPYLIDLRLVTNGQYAAFVKAANHAPPLSWGGAQPPAGTDDLPVVMVTWNDACAYAKWAGKRLPTEAEWEKAARWPAPEETDRDRLIAAIGKWKETKAEIEKRLAGAVDQGNGPALDLPNRWPWGGAWDADRVASKEGLLRVGSKPLGASPIGCLDMAGNAWQWTADWYRGYSPKAESKWFGEKMKVIRGGSFRNNDENSCRTSKRSTYQPLSTFDDLGFRCAKDAPE